MKQARNKQKLLLQQMRSRTRADHISNQTKQKEIKFQMLKRKTQDFFGKCFRCGRPDHLMPECKVSSSVKCNSCNNTGHLSTACSKCQSARSTQLQQPAPLTESADSTSYTVEYPPSEASFVSAAYAYTITTLSWFFSSFRSTGPGLNQGGGSIYI